jgi:hypothetical protein
MYAMILPDSRAGCRQWNVIAIFPARKSSGRREHETRWAGNGGAKSPLCWSRARCSLSAVVRLQAPLPEGAGGVLFTNTISVSNFALR